MPRSYIFIGLNAVRALSIISLLLVFASSIFVVVTDIKALNDFQAGKLAGNSTSVDNAKCDYIKGSTVPNQPAGVFWAVVNRLLIIFQVVILFLSEICWPLPFFERFFPVLGPAFGLGALGIFECLLGAAILSHHVDKFSLASGFFLFALGCLNMLFGLIFRESAKEKRSWHSDSETILPSVRVTTPVSRLSSASGSSDSTEKGGNGQTSLNVSTPVDLHSLYTPRPLSISDRSLPSPRNSSSAPKFQSSTSAI